MTPAQVVGAGLSGLATAWHLADAGFDVTVSDAAPGPGGLLQTRHTAHGLVETAANAFVWTETVRQWFDRLQIPRCSRAMRASAATFFATAGPGAGRFR